MTDEQMIAYIVAKAVARMQNMLGHRCSYAAWRNEHRWSNLDELAMVQRQAHASWLSKRGDDAYGVVNWDTSDGVATYQSATGRVRVVASEKRGTIEVSCWAGPNGNHPARVAASVTYVTTGGYAGNGRVWICIDEFIDTALVKGRSDRVEHLIDFDRGVFGNALAHSLVGRELLALYWYQRRADQSEFSLPDLTVAE